MLALTQFERVVYYELGIMKWADIDKDKFKKVQDVVLLSPEPRPNPDPDPEPNPNPNPNHNPNPNPSPKPNPIPIPVPIPNPNPHQVQDVVQQDVGHPLDEALMGDAFKSVKGVIHAALEKAKATVEGYERVTWTQCYLSVTDWFRELAPKPKARATAFLNAVELSTSRKLAELKMPIRLRWEVTSGFAEAQYEWKAVEYAVRQSGL